MVSLIKLYICCMEKSVVSPSTIFICVYSTHHVMSFVDTKIYIISCKRFTMESENNITERYMHEITNNISKRYVHEITKTL